MNFFQQQKLVISTLTPIHIGTGEDYEPGNYIIDKGYLYAFDPSVLSGKLSEQQIQRLLSIVEKEHIDERALLELQNFFKQNANLAKDIASYKVPVSKELEQFYKKRLGHVVQQERNNRNGRHKKVANKLEIERTCQNLHNYHYYIPGSSLKGAIRTAILDQLNTKKFLSYQEQQEVKNPKKANKLSQIIEQTTLNFRQVTEDPLKSIKISDAVFTPIEQDDFPQSTIHFCINKKRKPSKKRAMAEDNDLYQILECISKNQFRNINTDIRLFEDKQGKIQQLGINSFTKIAQICNAYYLPLLEKELQQLQVLNILPPSWEKLIQTLLLSEQIQQGKAFLLKIGKHGGADTKTLNGIRSIKIQKGRSNPPQYLPEPTTYWLAANNEKSSSNLLPFGWILLEIAESAEIEEVKTYMLEQTQAIRKQAQSDKEKQRQENELEIQYQAQEKIRQESEKQQKIIAQQKQELLASLSDEQRKIKELELLLEEKIQQNDKVAGGELSVLVNSLLNDSSILQWEISYKNQLADQLKAAFNFIGWGPKKKKAIKVEKILKLKN